MLVAVDSLFKQRVVFLFNKSSQEKILCVRRRLLSFFVRFACKANEASESSVHSFALPRGTNAYSSDL
jgi:hypothetical protein